MSSHGDVLPVLPGGEHAPGGPLGLRRPSGEGRKIARAAVASLAATAVDGAAYEACLAAARPTTHYAAAAAVGASLGAITNFALNRWWTFRGQRGPLGAQGLRYMVGSVLTLVVLQGVLWLLVERAALTAHVAWLPAKVVTWAVFSYPFQRLLVFRGARA